MNEIIRFQNELNRSRKNDFKVKSSHLKKEVLEYLKYASTFVPSNEQMCVIGTGQCSDIPLSFLLRTYENVLLTDIDIDTVKANSKGYDVDTMCVEYTGFDMHHFFDGLDDKLIHMKDRFELDYFLDEKLRLIQDYEFMTNKFETMDLIYISPIYTQLVFQQIRNFCTRLKIEYESSLIDYFEERMLQEMISVINRFNANCIHLLKENGVMVVASDILEVLKDSKFEKEVIERFKANQVNELYEDYVKRYGIGLGDYGLYNLDEKLDEIEYKWVLWEFDSVRKFIVKMKIYKNKSLKGGTL